MVNEIFNKSTGPQALIDLFNTAVDLTIYHDGYENYTGQPTLVNIYNDENKTGGPITSTLRYRSDSDNEDGFELVDVQVPNLLTEMEADIANTIGFFTFNNI